MKTVGGGYSTADHSEKQCQSADKAREAIQEIVNNVEAIRGSACEFNADNIKSTHNQSIINTKCWQKEEKQKSKQIRE